ncbi:unnamed protein product [Vitrella brassicaformis CCMP3155]|uniref:EF-hand domain-containing protein n=1 Tax=Vitrella brassicaformis (strain CCMP3155) TaxID=1169540 RepID=A0A0G4EH64_VITBC|nr:unnamed protein product [Vitrella brassicaformis CCMP3155]|eukprot:CEL95354.1 unnamed protein product [Vitrella brassicaformis CCMP3155]
MWGLGGGDDWTVTVTAARSMKSGKKAQRKGESPPPVPSICPQDSKEALLPILNTAAVDAQVYFQQLPAFLNQIDAHAISEACALFDSVTPSIIPLIACIFYEVECLKPADALPENGDQTKRDASKGAKSRKRKAVEPTIKVADAADVSAYLSEQERISIRTFLERARDFFCRGVFDYLEDAYVEEQCEAFRVAKTEPLLQLLKDIAADVKDKSDLSSEDLRHRRETLKRKQLNKLFVLEQLRAFRAGEGALLTNAKDVADSPEVRKQLERLYRRLIAHPVQATSPAEPDKAAALTSQPPISPTTPISAAFASLGFSPDTSPLAKRGTVQRRQSRVTFGKYSDTSASGSAQGSCGWDTYEWSGASPQPIMSGWSGAYDSADRILTLEDRNEFEAKKKSGRLWTDQPETQPGAQESPSASSVFSRAPTSISLLSYTAPIPMTGGKEHDDDSSPKSVLKVPRAAAEGAYAAVSSMRDMSERFAAWLAGKQKLCVEVPRHAGQEKERDTVVIVGDKTDLLNQCPYLEEILLEQRQRHEELREAVHEGAVRRHHEMTAGFLDEGEAPQRAKEGGIEKLKKLNAADADFSTLVDYILKYLLTNYGSIKKGFESLDVNEDGTLDMVDFEETMRQWGINKNAAQQIFLAVDVRQDGEIDLATLQRFFRWQLTEESDAPVMSLVDQFGKSDASLLMEIREKLLLRYGSVARAFSMIDVNKDQGLSQEEFIKAAGRIRICREDGMRLFQLMDLDRSGTVDMSEFQTALKDHQLDITGFTSFEDSALLSAFRLKLLKVYGSLPAAEDAFLEALTPSPSMRRRRSKLMGPSLMMGATVTAAGGDGQGPGGIDGENREIKYGSTLSLMDWLDLVQELALPMSEEEATAVHSVLDKTESGSIALSALFAAVRGGVLREGEQKSVVPSFLTDHHFNQFLDTFKDVRTEAMREVEEELQRQRSELDNLEAEAMVEATAFVSDHFDRLIESINRQRDKTLKALTVHLQTLTHMHKTRLEDAQKRVKETWSAKLQEWEDAVTHLTDKAAMEEEAKAHDHFPSGWDCVQLLKLSCWLRCDVKNRLIYHIANTFADVAFHAKWQETETEQYVTPDVLREIISRVPINTLSSLLEEWRVREKEMARLSVSEVRKESGLTFALSEEEKAKRAPQWSLKPLIDNEIRDRRLMAENLYKSWSLPVLKAARLRGQEEFPDLLEREIHHKTRRGQIRLYSEPRDAVDIDGYVATLACDKRYATVHATVECTAQELQKADRAFKPAEEHQTDDAQKPGPMRRAVTVRLVDEGAPEPFRATAGPKKTGRARLQTRRTAELILSIPPVPSQPPPRTFRSYFEVEILSLPNLYGAWGQVCIGLDAPRVTQNDVNLALPGQEGLPFPQKDRPAQAATTQKDGYVSPEAVSDETMLHMTTLAQGEEAGTCQQEGEQAPRSPSFPFKPDLSEAKSVGSRGGVVLQTNGVLHAFGEGIDTGHKLSTGDTLGIYVDQRGRGRSRRHRPYVLFTVNGIVLEGQELVERRRFQQQQEDDQAAEETDGDDEYPADDLRASFQRESSASRPSPPGIPIPNPQQYVLIPCACLYQILPPYHAIDETKLSIKERSSLKELLSPCAVRFNLSGPFKYRPGNSVAGYGWEPFDLNRDDMGDEGSSIGTLDFGT